jgi:hypothetical protein
MDSFSGNNQDPQSLHKYLYCHANPLNGVDPSGNEFSLTGLTIAMAIGATIGAIGGGIYSHYTGRSLWKSILIGAALGALAGVFIYLLWTGVASGALQRFFWDSRTFSTISRQYWQKFGPAAGRSLHHWLIPQRLANLFPIPQGILNAGFNLMELPNLIGGIGLNTWMGFAVRWGGCRMVVAVLVENGIRVLIPVTAWASYHAGKWLSNEITGSTINFAEGATATPINLTLDEERQMQDDTGNFLLEELDRAEEN